LDGTVVGIDMFVRYLMEDLAARIGQLSVAIVLVDGILLFRGQKSNRSGLWAELHHQLRRPPLAASNRAKINRDLAKALADPSIVETLASNAYTISFASRPAYEVFESG